MYSSSNFGKKEEEMMRAYQLQLDDAKGYFISCVKPRLDRSYKLYIAYNGDRKKEIQSWQNNIFVPYILSVVETIMPRTLDARPEFGVQGRMEDDQEKAIKVQNLSDFTWEIAGGDRTMEDWIRATAIYGTGFLQTSWKKDIREYRFLDSNDLSLKRLKWKKEKRNFYDAPYLEWVDNYSLWYDWHNIKRESKQFWFKRLVITGNEIKRKYPMADPERLEMAFANNNSDLTDFGSIRNEVKLAHEGINKQADFFSTSSVSGSLNTQIYQSQNDPKLKMYEVFEWLRPFEDKFAVIVAGVPILKGGYIPNPYDFKESTFIENVFLKLPNEFEGMGIPLILENPQIMLNTIKNQRLDAAMLNIHKMWIVNPLANIRKEDLIVRPFGIIYSTNPNGVTPVEFNDIKASAYKEEELLKSDMRYASGIDDFSMGQGGGANSATEVRHLRESTLERVRLFVNHIGDSLSVVLRQWISMYQQFFTEDMTIRIIGEDGRALFPLIQKDDIMGNFDFKATVLPSIAGKNDIEKKQGMDLFQLLINLPFVDPQKLTSKILHTWNWSLDSIVTKQEAAPTMEEGQSLPLDELQGMPTGLSQISPEVATKALEMMGYQGPNNFVNAGQQNPFAELSSPVDLGKSAPPPTVAGIKGPQRMQMPTTNPRGLNRGGKVNTAVNLKQNANPESALMNRTFNINK